MSYSPTTDFLALARLTSGGVRSERMPGLDYVVTALARAGLFLLSVGQTAPTTNQAATVWLRPSVPSWVAEGTVFIFNTSTAEYEIATPALWSALLTGGSSFQSIAAATGTVAAATTLFAIQRAAPAATAVLLPSIASRNGRLLKIVDFSTGVTNHTITLTTPDGSTIMQNASWQLLSTAAQLAGITLQPSPDLNAWIIAP